MSTVTVDRNILEWASQMPCEMEADDEEDYDPLVCSKHHTGRCWPCEARLRLAIEQEEARIVAMTDEEVRAEFIANGEGPDVVAEKSRDMMLGLVRQHRVLADIKAERVCQNEKWGRQDHPSVDPILLPRHDGLRMCQEYEIPSEARAKAMCDIAAKRGDVTWAHIATEEMSGVVEAFARGKDEDGRQELVQLGAVILQWIECIDRRNAEATQ